MVTPGHVYTRLLGATESRNNESWQMFSAPAGYQTIIRDVAFYSHDQAEKRFQLQWVYQARTYFLVVAVAPSQLSLHFDMRQVVPVGGLCFAYSDSGSWSCVITGYQFQDLSSRVGLLPASEDLWGNSPQE